MNYKLLKLHDKNEWNDILSELLPNQKDVYFTPEYLNLYEKNGDGEVHCFVFNSEGKIALYPYLSNKINSLGYKLDDVFYEIQGCYGYNGIITNSYNPEFIESFYDTFKSYCKTNNIIVEFTRFHTLLKNFEFSKKHLNITLNRKTIFIDLSNNIDIIKSEFSSSCKRAIKKAIKSNLEIRIDTCDFPYKNDFLKLYNKTMKRVNSSKYLYFSKEYFDEVFKLSNLVQFSCFKDNTLIASSLCLKSDNYYFHYHLGASNFKYLNLRPNNFLFLKMITYAKENNFKFIHFGGGSDQLETNTLFKFKSSFSKKLSNFYVGEKIYNEEIYNDIINQWSKKYPEKMEQFGDLILKYRY